MPPDSCDEIRFLPGGRQCPHRHGDCQPMPQPLAWRPIASRHEEHEVSADACEMATISIISRLRLRESMYRQRNIAGINIEIEDEICALRATRSAKYCIKRPAFVASRMKRKHQIMNARQNAIFKSLIIKASS